MNKYSLSYRSGFTCQGKTRTTLNCPSYSALKTVWGSFGAPHWDSFARGALFGLTRGSTAGHIARAALESIAYQVADLMDAVQTDTRTPLQELRVDGGASANDGLMQFQADILGVPVVRPAMTETTALGAAFLAGLATGLWKDVNTISNLPREERRFEPSLSRSQVDNMRQRWNEAISRTKSWEQVRGE